MPSAKKSGDWSLRNPPTGIASCCSRPTIGHATAPPSPAMNARRLMPILDPRKPHQYQHGISGIGTGEGADERNERSMARCPKWVKSGKAHTEQMLSALPQEQTFAR